jgi:hypothetical protein
MASDRYFGRGVPEPAEARAGLGWQEAQRTGAVVLRVTDGTPALCLMMTSSRGSPLPVWHSPQLISKEVGTVVRVWASTAPDPSLTVISATW